MARDNSPKRRQGKAVTATYGTLTLVLLVIIVSVAMALSPPTPPAVAEFAPQAEETIEDAPKNQSSQFGLGGDGECAPGQTCDIVVNGTRVTITPPKQPADPDSPDYKPEKVRRCVGTPPRQTEDPQSPPCVNYWEGDNGGATYKGVTANEIRIAVPCQACEKGQTLESRFEPYRRMEEHFNARYEFYGRKIRLVPVSVTLNSAAQSGGACPECGDEPPVQRAAAVRVDEELKVFASTAYAWENLWAHARTYEDELAKRKVISVVANPGYRNRDDFASRAPYQWSYSPPLDVNLASLGRFACNQLAGRRAEYAGAVSGAKTRKFGVIYQESDDGSPDLRPLLDALGGCNAPVEVGTWNDTVTDSGERTFTTFKARDVTTVICICVRLNAPLGFAQNTQYDPEHLIGAVGNTDVWTNQNFCCGSEQHRHIYGLAVSNKSQAPADQPWFWAVRESDPNYPSPLPAQADYVKEAFVYKQLLLLASGIQGAGPNLTPATFERALQRMKFPNPGAGAEPYFQAAVGFGPGDYSMTGDHGLMWWREAANSDGTGGPCYVDRGARWLPDRWPTVQQRDLRLFDPAAPCR